MNRLRPSFALALLAVAALAASACGGDEPEAEAVVETAPEDVGQPELLGLWTVTEVDGATPTSEVTLQFTPTGEMIRTEDGRQQRASYTFAAENYIEVTDATGITRYTLEIEDADTALLRTGGDTGTTLRLARRGGAVDLSDVPPTGGSAGAAVDTAAGTGDGDGSGGVGAAPGAPGAQTGSDAGDER